MIEKISYHIKNKEWFFSLVKKIVKISRKIYLGIFDHTSFMLGLLWSKNPIFTQYWLGKDIFPVLQCYSTVDYRLSQGMLSLYSFPSMS